MILSRRVFLAAAAGLGLGPVTGRAETSADGFQIVRARRVLAELMEPGAATPVWSFGDGAAPLVIRARQGDEFRLRFVNELEFEIWLHWFGVRGPSELMTLNVPAGASNSVDCVFTPPDAGTFWLGPMADQSRLRDMGLYAMLVVEEREKSGIFDEVTLILDDWKLTDSGAIEENFGDIEAMVGEGRLGNWFTVNGKYRLRIRVAGGRPARLRLLNAANVRTMTILLKGGDPRLVALDGQPILPRALGTGALSLAPGQRADMLVPTEAGMTMALDLFEDVAEIAYLVPSGGGPRLEIKRDLVLPANPISPEPDQGAARKVPLVIEGGIKGGLKQAIYRGQMTDLRELLEHGMGWAFNGVAGPGGPPLVEAKYGEAILFDVDNRTAFEQPIHVHGHVWRVVDGDVAWRDTAVVPPRARLGLLMVADNPGAWAIQSLIAERADGGLLAAFSVAE